VWIPEKTINKLQRAIEKQSSAAGGHHHHYLRRRRHHHKLQLKFDVSLII